MLESEYQDKSPWNAIFPKYWKHAIFPKSHNIDIITIFFFSFFLYFPFLFPPECSIYEDYVITNYDVP